MKVLEEMGRWLKAKLPEVLSSTASGAYEMEREGEVRFTTADRNKARSLVPILRRSAKGDWITLPKAVGRTALLAAARSLVRDADVEWAVVGLGTASAKGRSFVRQVIARRGTKDRAPLPTSVLNDMRGHLETKDGGEIVHVHSHPQNLQRAVKNVLLGDTPLVSWADQRFHLSYELEKRLLNERALRPRVVRCFLVENDRVRRYWLPPPPELALLGLRELQELGLAGNLTSASVVLLFRELGFRPDDKLIQRILAGRP